MIVYMNIYIYIYIYLDREWKRNVEKRRRRVRRTFLKAIQIGVSKKKNDISRDTIYKVG